MTAKAVTLLCFPPAGAGAGIYAPWSALLPDRIALAAVELPGRGARSDETAIGDMRELVERLVAEVAPLAQAPYAVFGHSIGAKIGFEVARVLDARGARPRHLFVAASPSGAYPSRGKGLHLLPREALLTELRVMGTSDRVLESDRLVDLLLPSIRADFQLATEYAPFAGPKLSCPITAFAGTLDPDIAVDDVAGWETHTSGRFALTRLEAGHNFLKERSADLTREIARSLEGARDAQER